MDTYSLLPKQARKPMLIATILFIGSIQLFLSSTLFAQPGRLIKGESASCKVTVNTPISFRDKQLRKPSRSLNVTPNQIGVFNKVSNIQPLAIVPVEVYYPDGRDKEQVILTAEDGGKFENGKGVKVATLNASKKVAFDFQVAANPGIYRILLSKGYDTKVVQLWVGSEPSTTKLK